MSEKTIFEKLFSIQSELKAPKGQFNKFGKYKYRSCEDILEAVKPLLAKHKACIGLSDEIVFIEGRFYIKAVAELFDGIGKITASAYAREADEKKGMDPAQVTGAASSYARKYALNGLLCIDDNKDDPDNKKPSDNEPNKPLKKNSVKWENKLKSEIKPETLTKLKKGLASGDYVKSAIKEIYDNMGAEDLEKMILNNKVIKGVSDEV